MNTRVIAAMTAGMLAIGAASSVHADVVYSNFGPGDSFDASFGGRIFGDISLKAGVSFVVNGTFSLDSIELAMSVSPIGAGDVVVMLYADDGGAPGALLESLGGINVTAPDGIGDIYTVTSTVNTPLHNGQTYFIGVLPNDQTTDVAWLDNVIGESGRWSSAFGNPWGLTSGATPTFRVNGTVLSVYDTGFEAPTFTLGGLNGQDGWVGGGTVANITVQNAVVNSGGQAIQIDATGASIFTNAGCPPVTASGIVSLSADVYLGATGTISEWRFTGIGDTGFLGSVIIFSDDRVIVQGGTQVDTGFSVTRRVWHRFELIFDFSTQTFCVIMDGSIIALNMQISDVNSTSLLRGQLIASFPGTDIAYFDNFVISEQTGDEIVDAITMCGDFFAGTTTDNTGSTGDDSSCTGGGLMGDAIDEWLAWTAPQDCGTATATTCNPGTNYNSALAVFDASGGTELACNDDDFSCPLDTQWSTVTWDTLSGETYMIRVSGFGDAVGTYELTINHTPCQSDLNCDGVVNVNDLLALLAGWGTPAGDVDGDGDTDVNDLLDLLAGWGGACL